MAKIAAAVEQALARRVLDGAPGRVTARLLAQGDGWTVEDVVCTSGPDDRPFEERHTDFAIAIVTAGSFQYRAANAGSRTGEALMTPGSLLLGNVEQCFECGHEHVAGDRCLSFRYAPDYFERIAAEAGARGASRRFPAPRVPPSRWLSSLIARACAGLEGSPVAWEELSLQLAARTIQLASGLPDDPPSAPPGAVARMTRAVRTIDRHPDAGLGTASLAREAGLSPYHFLRTFRRVIGVTPHQYVLRARLREAALRLAAEPAKILDIALDCGFGDVSNFNRAFRTEFGVSPRVFRRQPIVASGFSRTL